MKQITADGKLQTINKAGLDMMEADSIEQVQDKCVYPMVSEEYREAYKDMVCNVFQGQRQNLEFKAISLKGNPRWLYSQVVPLLNSNGEVVSALSVTVDITGHKRQEEDRLRNQKLESLGMLAAGIAHDFNNLLTGIKGNISLVARQDSRKVREELMEEAIKATDRAADLTGKLLAFAKDNVPKKAVGSIAKVIQDSAEFSLGKSSLSCCKLSLPDSLWSVEMDAGQISQVIQNLVINANQAMPEGGVICIRAENVELPAGNMYELEAGAFVHIVICDTGVGIPEKYLEKIFDPYFTTKDRGGGGSGLGLAVAYTVIKNHKGIITVESEQGVGTTFNIFLPATKTAVAQEKVAQESLGSSRRLKILVMDDEVMIRNVLHSMLSLINHQVELTADGREALEKYAVALRSKDPFDLVILDLTVPGGMGGVETLEKLREIDPGVVAIVSSGYSDARPEGFSGVLGKPYDVQKLESLIQEVLKTKL